MQDYISMTLLWFATQPTQPSDSSEDGEIKRGLQLLEQLIDAELKQR